MKEDDEQLEQDDSIDNDSLQAELDKLESKPESTGEEFPEVITRLDYEIDITSLDGDNPTKIPEMAEIILRNNYFVTDGFSGELYVFIEKGKLGGTYIEATQTLEHTIKQIAIYHHIENAWGKKTTRREVYDYINVGLKRLEEPDLRHINVANGLVYLTPKGEFMHFTDEWSPEYVTTTKLPIKFDPLAKCPTWEQVVSNIFPEDYQHIAWELIALLVLPIKNKAASGIILKGAKNTGKTTFQNAVTCFLGEKNVSNLSLDMFGERFQTTQLKGKLANIVGEISNNRLTAKAINTIKQLIGNDMLAGEVKYGASFMFKSYARCLFSCNEMPSCDSDDAFFDRFYIIPFNRKQFDKNPIKEQEINALLTSPEELSGVFNKALKALPKVMLEGIKATPSMKAEHDSVVVYNDGLMSWKAEYLEEGEGFKCLFDELHEHYKQREPSDYARKSDRTFGRDLKKLLHPSIRKVQIMMEDGSRPYGYKGIRLRESVEELDQTGFMEFDLESLA